MIPRLKPSLDHREIFTLLHPQTADAVSRFEMEFAQTFDAEAAIAFPYGRSALWAIFKALGIKNTEIIMPAYTCSVVAHATVLSENQPRFVDITLTDYNMDLGHVERAINEQTRAVIATHLFGYPLDVDRLTTIVHAAERRFGHKIWVIQDCAHAFGACWQGRLVSNAGDVALYGLNISKMMTSIFGGMLTTNNADLAEQLRQWRDEHFNNPNFVKALQRRLYLMAIYPAFNQRAYSFVNWLQEKTSLLNRLTKAYHLDEKIHFPPDYLDRMTAVEAQVGRVQLHKYPEIVRQRQETAQFYSEHLPASASWVLPPIVEGATYSHYVVRVSDRRSWLRVARKAAIEFGQLIEYSIPEMRTYQKYTNGAEFPNARLAMQSTINLPIHHGITKTKRQKIVNLVHSVMSNQNYS
ncbi:MAG: DegT/DnrJ/EryC1/StrS aminotransferase family protein [Anaerolineae bacterium]|nr:DegT/DnrJ/EryC1/StrS aminotransferase family protein [Anaerolineae bacterium]